MSKLMISTVFGNFSNTKNTICKQKSVKLVEISVKIIDQISIL